MTCAETCSYVAWHCMLACVHQPWPSPCASFLSHTQVYVWKGDRGPPHRKWFLAPDAWESGERHALVLSRLELVTLAWLGVAWIDKAPARTALRLCLRLGSPRRLACSTLLLLVVNKRMLCICPRRPRRAPGVLRAGHQPTLTCMYCCSIACTSIPLCRPRRAPGVLRAGHQPAQGDDGCAAVVGCRARAHEGPHQRVVSGTACIVAPPCNM